MAYKSTAFDGTHDVIVKIQFEDTEHEFEKIKYMYRWPNQTLKEFEDQRYEDGSPFFKAYAFRYPLDHGVGVTVEDWDPKDPFNIVDEEIHSILWPLLTLEEFTDQVHDIFRVRL